MKAAIVRIEGTSPYSQSRHFEATEEDAISWLGKDANPVKRQGETHDAYEKRTWRNRMHVRKEDGKVYIPGAVFSNGIKEAAKDMAIKIPGRGQKTYTKAFEAGVMVLTDVVLDQLASDVPCDKLFVPSDGIRGSGKRVTKYFSRIDTWGGEVTFHLFDDAITREVFTTVLNRFGQMIGVGRWRPAKCGTYGRFRAEVLSFESVDMDSFAA